MPSPPKLQRPGIPTTRTVAREGGPSVEKPAVGAASEVGGPAQAAEPEDQVERGPRRAFNPVLTLLNRFGTVKPMSDEERARDLAYRAERAKALADAFPRLTQSAAPFDVLLREAHAILNVDKKFSMVQRLSALIIGNNLQHEGRFRTGPNRAGNYVAPASTDVAPLMASFGATVGRLIDDAQARGDDAAARNAAAWALAVMIRIHPFMDGNGRTARAAMNLTLAKAGQKTIDFPSDSEGVYKKSIVWQRLKDHMRVFTKDVGWTMYDGIVPPSGYSEKVHGLLAEEIRSTTPSSLAARADIVAIANALAHVREHGFE